MYMNEIRSATFKKVNSIADANKLVKITKSLKTTPLLEKSHGNDVMVAEGLKHLKVGFKGDGIQSKRQTISHVEEKPFNLFATHDELINYPKYTSSQNISMKRDSVRKAKSRRPKSPLLSSQQKKLKFFKLQQKNWNKTQKSINLKSKRNSHSHSIFDI